MATPTTETTKGGFHSENADNYEPKKSKEGEYESKDLEKAKSYLKRVKIKKYIFFTLFTFKKCSTVGNFSGETGF